ncbi:TonB-dependent receptor [Longimicrobium sp.]|uniref:TonB-dependent receptor n=1 Tax=Longimicrobium sp. TaxID=2029185 RepID=UPI002E318430|nr:TonB-dependent receptor [Longimicrobium sp.]HEX6038615.1 TonB-dependent receptor [Longimicrobium sp.]
MSTPVVSRSRRLIAALAALVLCAAPAAAQQTGAIEGTVVSAAGGEPLSGATVRIDDARSAVTDAAGRFRIANLSAGAYTLRAARVGYADATASADVRAGATAAVRIALAERSVMLDELVVVSATREVRRLAETPATVGVVGGAELRAARPAHPAEVMGQIPGVWVSVTGGEGHTTAIRQPKTTNPVYLFLEDGVPTRSTGFFNHNALYEVNVPQAERIEVLKGPATALYGSDAIGGVINVESRAPSAGRTMEAYVERGAFGWNRLLASAGGMRGGDGVRADLNLTRTDGWRTGTAYDRQSATLRWDRTMGGGQSLKTVMTYSRIDQQTAGASTLRADDYASNPTANYTPISFRDVRAFRLSTAYERAGGRTLLSVTPFVRWNTMELLPNWSLSYDPTVYTTGHRSLGLLARYRVDLDAVRTRLIGGVDVDFSPGGRQEDSVAAVRDGSIYRSYTTGPRLYDYRVTFHGVSPYLHAETSPFDGLRFTAGLRADFVGYDYDNRLDALQTGKHRRPDDTEVSYAHLSPKLGGTYEFGPALGIFASYAHGFRAPSEGQLFRQGQADNTVGLDPVRADSWETGARGSILGRLTYQVSAYRMHVRDDILTFTDTRTGTRETSNAGRTLHRGLEVGLGAALPAGLRADLSWSRAKHTYEAWSPRPDVDFAGNEMESAPRTLLSARLGWRPTWMEGADFAAEWARIGSYWMDADNTHRYPGHALVNLRADVPLAGGIEVVSRVSNLLDKRYAEGASYTQALGEEFAPGMPRTVYLGLQWRWEGGR